LLIAGFSDLEIFDKDAAKAISQSPNPPISTLFLNCEIVGFSDLEIFDKDAAKAIPKSRNL